MLEELLLQDFPFLEIEKLMDVEASDDGGSITGRILTTNKYVYSFYFDKEALKPTLQRFM
jgi:hypothetical protein